MVKDHFLQPAAFIMAVDAFFPLLAAVGVFVFVAAVTFFRQLFLEFAAMTVLAGDILVFAFQREVGFVVIEFVFGKIPG